MARSGKIMASAAFLLAVFAQGSSALADSFYLQLNGAPLFSASNRSMEGGGGAFSDPPVKEESGFGYDFRGSIGPVFWSWLFVGFNFNHANLPMKRDAVEAGAPSQDSYTKTTNYGPALGIVKGGFHLVTSALVAGSQEISDKRVAFDGTVETDLYWKNQVGLGYQIDIGYSIPLGRNIKIGPSLVYQKINYKRQTRRNALDPASDITDEAYTTRAVNGSLTPLISLIFSLR